MPYSLAALVSILFLAILNNLTEVTHNKTCHGFSSPAEPLCAQFVKLASCTSAEPDLMQRLDALHHSVSNRELRKMISILPPALTSSFMISSQRHLLDNTPMQSLQRRQVPRTPLGTWLIGSSILTLYFSAHNILKKSRMI